MRATFAPRRLKFKGDQSSKSARVIKDFSSSVVLFHSASHVGGQQQSVVLLVGSGSSLAVVEQNSIRT